MLKVAICDDDQRFCQKLENIIQTYLKNKNIKYQLEIFFDGQEIWSKYQNEEYYDLILLDINMKELDGIQLGQKIRKELKDEKTKIIYLSSLDNRDYELFPIRPFGFIRKPIKEESIATILDEYFEIIAEKEKNYFTFISDGKQKNIPFSEIYYFESKRKHIIIICQKENQQFRKTINELENSINHSNFLRIHQSFIINIEQVIEHNYDSVIMKNGITLNISKKYRKEYGEIIFGKVKKIADE